MPKRRGGSAREARRRDADRDLDLFAPPPAPLAEPAHSVSDQYTPYDSLGDAFPGASPGSAVSVATLTQTAKDVVEGAFTPLWVRGEVIDFKKHRNGHWYFALRDGSAQLRCVVWSRDRRGIPAPPDDGMQVAALGQLSVYAARGEIQFSVRRLEAEGAGLWRKALELTRARLEADGLLAPERKRRLPRYPAVIAAVTSPDGAALHDIVAVLRRRAPHVRVVVVPVAVQGDGAPAELCDALDRVSRWARADTVIVGRGGGGREDLWAFNDERVARALARCPMPTISAVGHEIDVTICDLVADVRAPTPSAAAEAAVRATDELRSELGVLGRRLLGATARNVDDADERLRVAAHDLASSGRLGLERRDAALGAVAGRLHALSPLATLSRGYAIARADDGRTLASVEQFSPGSPFDLVLRDGTVRADTVETRPTPPRENS